MNEHSKVDKTIEQIAKRFGIKASRRSWDHMVPANTVRFLHVPVKRTIWELEIGTVKFTVIHQKRPVTPEEFLDLERNPRKRDSVPKAVDLLSELTKTLDRNHRDHPFGIEDR